MISNPESFRAEARYQGRCAVCGSDGDFDAHHVVERQELRRRGLDQFPIGNSLRLCKRGRCHDRHTSALARVPLTALTEGNLDYAFGALGAYAYDYLARRYAGADPRLEQRLHAFMP